MADFFLSKPQNYIDSLAQDYSLSITGDTCLG